MDSLQKQVISLTSKVDALYKITDQLSEKVSNAFSECRLTPIQGKQDAVGRESGQYSGPTYSTFRPTMEHKDVLIDNNELDTHHANSEKELSPQIQIQRLTAQLTAAYNRIAALEEQLIAHRIH